jgi:colanic acid biosynthesis glycosyl transferase WcaI
VKIVFLNQCFYPDVVSSAQHLADLASALADRGHQVTVITGRRAYDDPQTLFESNEDWNRVRVIRLRCCGLGKSKKWRRMVDAVSLLASSFLRLVFLPRADLIVALTSPPFIGAIGLIIARFQKARFVQWVMDLNPDEAFAAGWLRRDSLMGVALERISCMTMRGADLVIALDRFMQARIISKGVDRRRVRVLPPWSHQPEVRFDAQGRKRFRLRHGLQEKFVVMYSGNHSPCHPLDTVLRAAEVLAHDRNIVFCFVGGGSEFRRIQRRFADSLSKRGFLNQPNILCLPYQPLSELSASLSAADLHLVVMGQNFVGVVHPCKIYNILAVGCPVMYVGPRPSPTLDILDQPGLKHCYGAVAHGDDVGLVHHIQRVRENRPILSLARLPGAATRETMRELISQLESLAESTRGAALRNIRTRGLRKTDEAGMAAIAGDQNPIK